MVDDANEVVVIVDDEDGVNLVLLHHSLYLADFRLRANGLWAAGHDVADGMVEELGLPAFYGSTNVTISDESYYLSADHGYAQSQFSFADEHDGMSQTLIG